MTRVKKYKPQWVNSPNLIQKIVASRGPRITSYNVCYTKLLRKGYSVTLPPPHPRLRRSVILHEARVALTPMGDALRVGGTMELAGYDLSISPPRLRGIATSLRRYLPEVEERVFDGRTPWCGLRPCTPDGLPYIGRVERYET